MPPDPVEPPDDFGDLESWRFSGDDDSIGHELVRDWAAAWETGWIADQVELRDFDEWAGVRVECDSDNQWSVTITYEDGNSETISLGEEGWSNAWDLYDIADGAGLEAERGDIDYTGD